MENKLQELTDKLYKEGLSKGKEEGEEFLKKAREQADAIVAKARKEAEDILKKASKEAEDYKTKVEGDVKMAATQSIQATKKDIENLLVGNMVEKQVDDAMSSADFVKKVIKEVAEKFSADESVDLNLVLPESMKKDLDKFVTSELGKSLKGSVKAEFSKKIGGGFTIGPKDGSYFISLTDESFKNLIGEYLRPATRKILFGE